MSNLNSFFPDIFQEEDCEEESIVVNECICSECQGVFILPSESNIDACPLCGTLFD